METTDRLVNLVAITDKETEEEEVVVAGITAGEKKKKLIKKKYRKRSGRHKPSYLEAAAGARA
jgi:hypothetical protein